MSNKLNVENLSTININAKIVKFNSHVNERQKAINMPICKGILYGLGTDFDEVPYVNPALNGNVAITSSSLLEGELVHLLEWPVTKHSYFETEEEPNAFITIEFINHEVSLSSLVLAYPPLKMCDHIPINFRIEGSDDGLHWRTLASYRKAESMSMIKWPHVMLCDINDHMVDQEHDINVNSSDISMNINEKGIDETSKDGLNFQTADLEFHKYIRIVHLGNTYPTSSDFFVLSGVEMFGIIRDCQTQYQHENKGCIDEKLKDTVEKLNIQEQLSSDQLETNQMTIDVHGGVINVIVLVSKHDIATSSQLSNCDLVLNIFDAKNIPINVIDGSSRYTKQNRDILFQISQTRIYPQIFKEVMVENKANDQITTNVVYFGGFEELQEVVDNEDIALNLRKKFPSIETFETLFGHLRNL